MKRWILFAVMLTACERHWTGNPDDLVTVRVGGAWLLNDYVTILVEVTNENEKTIHDVILTAALFRSGLPLDTSDVHYQAIGSGITARDYWDSRKLDRFDSLEFRPLRLEADELSTIWDTGGK